MIKNVIITRYFEKVFVISEKLNATPDNVCPFACRPSPNHPYYTVDVVDHDVHDDYDDGWTLFRTEKKINKTSYNFEFERNKDNTWYISIWFNLETNRRSISLLVKYIG